MVSVSIDTDAAAILQAFVAVSRRDKCSADGGWNPSDRCNGRSGALQTRMKAARRVSEVRLVHLLAGMTAEFFDGVTLITQSKYLCASVATIALLAASAVEMVHADQSRQICDDEYRVAINSTVESNAPEVRSLRRTIETAVTSFRFHDTKQAQAQLKRAAVKLAAWSYILSDDTRQEFADALEALRRCITTSVAPAMATLTVRAFDFEEGAPDGRGAAAGAGYYVRVDEMTVGRTRRDGTVTARVPSGPLRVVAFKPPSFWGLALITLAPGESGTASIVLSDGKEPADEIDLELREMNRGVLPATSRSITLQFTRDDRRVPVTWIEHIESLDASDNIEAVLGDMFRVVNGAIVAVDAGRLLTRLRGERTQKVRLRVTAADGDGLRLSNIVEFRVE